MSHKKARSCSESGSRVSFSWEQKPGIPIFHIPSRSFNAAIAAEPNLRKSASFHFESLSNCTTNMMNISPPPLVVHHQWDRSKCSSEKGDDPFAAAIKKCTKHIASQGLISKGNNVGSNKDRISKSVFSCKKSCDVREDNVVRRSDGMPPLPHRGGRSKDQAMAELEHFLMRVGESKERMRNSKNIREKVLKSFNWDGGTSIHVWLCCRIKFEEN